MAKKFQAKHDVILYYSKSKSSVFNTLYDSPTEGSLKTFESAMRRGYNVNLSKKMVTVFDWDKYNQAVKDKKIPSDLNPKEFGDGKPPMKDWWEDIKILGGPKNKERLGYPTQKPLALLERIVRAGSNEGDLVLDPFCGCGTAIEAAVNLERKWVGVDISPFAIDLVREKRLEPRGIQPRTFGIPQDLAGARKLARERPFDFEAWAVTRIAGLAPNESQVADRGIDGRGSLFTKLDDGRSLVIAQVKGGAFKLSQLREFLHVAERDEAAFGVYITLDPVASRDAKREVAAAGSVKFGAQSYPRVQLWTVEDYFSGRFPSLPPLADPFTGKAMEPSLFSGGV